MLHLKNLSREYCPDGKICISSLLCGSFCLLLILAAWGKSFAGSQVTADYTVKGNIIVLKIKTSETGPGNIIVTQHLPSGNEITSAEPAFSAYHARKAQAKWLLKALNPGTHKITLEMKKPVDKKKISAVISFMNPETGELSIIKVNP